jgi:DNA-binding NarL/FixJ family response regulator
MQDYKPKGKIEMRTTETTPMASTKDAHTLSSGTRMEEAYANYANTMKYLANSARKEAYVIKAPKRNSDAAKQYKAEVESLTAKLNTAKANSSRERQANLIADKAIEVAKKSDPDRYYGPDGKDEMKKLRTQTLKAAREKTGANKLQVSITDREAEAIQANAISASMLEEIMQNGDMDQIRSIFTPKDNKAILRQKVQRAKMYADNGYTNAEIAKALGVSTGTVSDYLYNY